MKRNFAILTTILFFLITGCNNRPPEKKKKTTPSETTAPAPVVQPGCRGCHQDMRPDSNHQFACTVCHDGNDQASSKQTAHRNLVTRPAQPATMATRCGKCHPDQVAGCRNSLHFTLQKAINLVRNHFEAKTALDSLTEIPTVDKPSTGPELADDMLRRRCLRCHVYTPGDAYAMVTRGTGCAACHLAFSDGKLESHEFIVSPADRQCQSCHYANHVGADYSGRFEHDFNWEYRTPYTTRDPFIRPYGVEYHDLVPDIHEQRGLSCIDCHGGKSLMEKRSPSLSCRTCHGWRVEDPLPSLLKVHVDDNKLILTTIDGNEHPVPPLTHPAHERYGKHVACQVCHAQWSFNDSTTYLLLSEVDDYEMWERLTVQSSSEVEQFLEHNLYSDGEELEPAMRDGITGVSRPGIWYKGFGQRRWENIIVRRDTDGMIKVFRPILDLRLSFIDSEGEVLFDNLRGKGSGLLPYTPHTTGPAGLFYRQRFADLLTEKAPPATLP